MNGTLETSENHSERTDGNKHSRDLATTPIVVTWEVTQACTLSCDHCRATANPRRDPGELDTREAKSLFDQVASFSPQPFFVFSGGDPLSRPDIFELLECATAAGLTPSITPATTAKLTDGVIDRFVDIGVRRMGLSLDGSTAASHDRFRGEVGTFATVMRAAKIANERGLPIQINTTVTASTADELPAIADLIDELDAIMWEVFFLVPIGRGDQLEQLPRSRVRSIMDWLYRRSRHSSYRVITVEAPFYRRVAQNVQRELGERIRPVGATGAGKGFVFVSHTGEVFPSGFLPISVGNVRNTPLPTLYRDSPLMQRLRKPDNLRGSCGSCSFTAECGGSRSRAFATSGNPFGSDPLCPWVDE